jgi:hypothetical protein
LDKKAKKKTNDRINLNNKQPTIATIFPSVWNACICEKKNATVHWFKSFSYFVCVTLCVNYKRIFYKHLSVFIVIPGRYFLLGASKAMFILFYLTWQTTHEWDWSWHCGPDRTCDLYMHTKIYNWHCM